MYQAEWEAGGRDPACPGQAACLCEDRRQCTHKKQELHVERGAGRVKMGDSISRWGETAPLRRAFATCWGRNTLVSSGANAEYSARDSQPRRMPSS